MVTIRPIFVRVVPPAAILLLFLAHGLGAPIFETNSRSGTLPKLLSDNEKSHGERRQGLTSQPDGRGTLDIVWSCSVTLFLCSWSILCINIPASNDSHFKIYVRKLFLSILCFIGPEFIFQIALAQWESARRSVGDFHAAGYTQWSMGHAFFADMGGFVLQTRDWVPFPINAKQLHYLLTMGYVKYPKLTKRDISDKNKVDGVLRVITICQTLWFVINIAARAGQNLAIATAELTTGAFVLCTYATMFCWAHKPADIHAPEIIECETTIAQILLEAGERARQPYRRTPLDFVSRTEWPWSRYWSSFMNSLRIIGLPFVQTVRPLNRLENTVIPEPSRTGYHFALFLTIAYLSIFVAAWKYSFPTRAELICWRVSCLAVIGCTVFFWVVGEFTHSVYPALQRHFSFSSGRERSSGLSRAREAGSGNTVYKRAYVRFISGLRNNSIGQDPNYDLPVKAILSLYIAGLIYAFARTYILLEDVIELRSLPISAYETVKWSKVFLHF